jgi:[protein-PII] uridylyltransferase
VPASTLRAHLEDRRHELRGLLGSRATAGVQLARRHAEIMDALLLQLYGGAAVGPRRQPPGSFALAAVGGYGRRLLACKSDLDVRFVTSGPPEALRDFVQAMLYPLWDAGVSIGHQVVSVGEAVKAAKGDLPTATALLDLRLLAGDPAVIEELSRKAYASVFSAAELPSFLQRLEQQAQARYERFGDSLYLLEPEVKNGTGGLRDLDLALWAARARFRTSDLGELQALSVISAAQVEEVTRASDFLWALRNHLHTRAGRRNDRLTFADQEALAPLFGYATSVDVPPGASETQRLGVMVEAFMSDYYRHARAITRLRDQVIGRAKRREGVSRPREVDLGNGLLSCGGGVGLRDERQLHSDPAVALRLYAAAVEQDLTVLAQSRDAIAQAAGDEAFAAALRSSPEASALFVSLVTTCRQARFRNGSILGELHDVGLLVAMLPEFAPVVGRVHHDMYHVYTVDVHSVAAVDRLRALVRGDLAAEQPLACRLAAEIVRPATLFMATLLHDVGKAIGGHDHSARGARMARSILGRLGLAQEAVDDACHLIDKHLVMYLMAVQRDLADPATVDDLLRETRSPEGLRDLYLLTVADLSTTSPTSMTRWKAGMLDALLREGEARLSGESNDEASRLSRVRDQVRSEWSSPADRDFLEQYLASMPDRYLLSNPASAIVVHATAALQRPGDWVTATLVPPHDADVVQLCVVTDARANAELCVVAADRPGLLAAIAAAISANGLEIHAAQINSRPLPEGGVQAVDVFWVRSARGVAGVAERLPNVERDLRLLVSGALRPDALLKRSRAARSSDRHTPSVFTEIVIDNRASERYTVIEVLSADRAALLFMLAQALHEIGISIHVAKINTEGSRVIDVFYVTEADGTKILPGPRSDQVRTALDWVLRPAAALASSA